MVFVMPINSEYGVNMILIYLNDTMAGSKGEVEPNTGDGCDVLLIYCVSICSGFAQLKHSFVFVLVFCSKTKAPDLSHSCQNYFLPDLAIDQVKCINSSCSRTLI
ncbi:hypothetical protein GOODEAATRI_013727 [Goodea atripinnis]|uniref:Uncharacterized protein n=1 Tax=Goodea atripinnis TaxID=208336 RepID=A0ABV0NAF8_9TELE